MPMNDKLQAVSGFNAGVPLLMNPERLGHYYRPDMAAAIQNRNGFAQSWESDFLAKFEPITPEMIGDTAVIRISGPIEYRLTWYGLMFGATSTRAVDMAFQKCVDDPDVARIVLHLDTTGGDPIGVAECAKRIFDQRGAKPSVALVDPYCASAGLWFAAACGKVVALQSAWIGWMGTMTVIESYAKMLEMMGVDQRVICAPEKKAEWHPARPISEDYVAWNQEMVDELTSQFVKTIAKYRGVTTQYATENFGQGRGLRATQAKEVGLVDEITTGSHLYLAGSKRKSGGRSGQSGKSQSVDLATMRAAAF